MVDVKKFNKAVWTTRLKYGRKFLRKSQLAEAFKLYQEAEGNRERFEDLLKQVFIGKHETK